MPRKKLAIVRQSYPPIPKDASIIDVVEEYYTYTDKNGRIVREIVGAVYCPRQEGVDEDHLPFDPSTPAAQKALDKLQPEIKKMRRYDRDIKRRRAIARSLQEAKS